MSNDPDEIIDAEIVDSDNVPAVIEASTRSSINNGAAAFPRWSEEFWRRASPDVQARRCVAHKQNGNRCLKAAIKGATVCRTHGGATKHVQRAARIRLENAQDLMAQKLLGVALTAESEAVKLAAIKDVLDRGGLKAPSEVVLSQGETKPYEELFDGIGTMSRAESRRARGIPDTQDNFAGVDHAHLHASSQEGAERQSCTPPAQSDSPDSTDHGDRGAPRKSSDPTTDTGDFDYQGANRSGQYGASDSPESPMHRSGPRTVDRDGQSERRQRPRSQVRHITGDDAIRLASEANRAIGALPPMRELESPHKRYRRP